MVLVQLLLPAARDTDAGEHATPFAQTRRELTDRFGGLTVYIRSPAKGLWTSSDGQLEQDDVVMVEPVTGVFDRAWWRAYGATLRRRFHQEAIHVRALSVEMLDDTAPIRAWISDRH